MKLGFLFKRIAKKTVFLPKLLDFILAPINIISLLWLRFAKFYSINRLLVTAWMTRKIGIVPIVNHYYEPFYFYDQITQGARNLSEIDFRIDDQKSLLKKFNFYNELSKLPIEENKPLSFYHENGSYGYADADIYYSIIRFFKPRRIVEIGSGFSTLLALEAKKNNDFEGNQLEIECIEPYEMQWLEELPVIVSRKKVQDVSLATFENLKANDILFIDSSHIIKPGGDLLFEFFEILPVLKKGVIIHFHDIFTPFHYPTLWVRDHQRLWNEQYLLEAFLSNNSNYQVLFSGAYFFDKFKEDMLAVFPRIKNSGGCSFWLVKA